MATVAEPQMTKRSDSPRNDVTVKMDAEVVRKAKIVAAYRNQSMAEFLSVELGTIIDRLLEEAHAREVSGPRATKKGKGGGKA
jgi:hypothetical protein